MTSPAQDPMAAPDDNPPPLIPADAAKPLDQQITDLQKMVSALLAIQQGNMQLMAGVMNGMATPLKPTDEALQATAQAAPMPEAKPEKRVKIILDDNDEIPPGGQFLSVDGRPYLLQANMEADVPVSLLDVLDHALTSKPIVDPQTLQVVGYTPRLRFPYRMVRDREAAREAATGE